MSRDVGQQMAERLGREWSAPRVAAQLQTDQLEALISRFESLEPLAKARALLTGIFMRPDALAACKPQLQSLAEIAQGDDDEWVRVIGRAVGSYSGRLDLDAVTSESRLVAGTLADLRQLLDEHPPCPDFRPLEELYLSQRARAARGSNGKPRAHSHFLLRTPPPALLDTDADAVAALLPSLNTTQDAGIAAALPVSAVSPAVPSAETAAAQMGLSSPVHSPRRPPAAAEADMFLSSRPVVHGRPVSLGERGRGVAVRQKRTKQIDIQEVAAMNKAAAEGAAAAAAAAAAQQAAHQQSVAERSTTLQRDQHADGSAKPASPDGEDNAQRAAPSKRVGTGGAAARILSGAAIGSSGGGTGGAAARILSGGLSGADRRRASRQSSSPQLEADVDDRRQWEDGHVADQHHRDQRPGSGSSIDRHHEMNGRRPQEADGSTYGREPYHDHRRPEHNHRAAVYHDHVLQQRQQHPESPESGEVAEEEGELPPSPVSKRQRTDGGEVEWD